MNKFNNIEFQPEGVTVYRKKDEPFITLMNRFKRKTKKFNIIKEYEERQHFQRDKKRLKKMRNIKKKQERENENILSN